MILPDNHPTASSLLFSYVSHISPDYTNNQYDHSSSVGLKSDIPPSQTYLHHTAGLLLGATTQTHESFSPVNGCQKLDQSGWINWSAGVNADLEGLLGSCMYTVGLIDVCLLCDWHRGFLQPL